MDITENPDGSFTATSEDFVDCAFAGAVVYDDDYPWDDRADCWWSGATLEISYDVAGLEGRHVMHVCASHRLDALDDLEDPRRSPYTCRNITEATL